MDVSSDHHTILAKVNAKLAKECKNQDKENKIQRYISNCSWYSYERYQQGQNMHVCRAEYALNVMNRQALDPTEIVMTKLQLRLILEQ